jgi:methylated-DNA-[protein]-cysteine S-methyltransferase
MKNVKSQQFKDLKIAHYESPIGVVEVTESGAQIHSILFLDSNQEKESEQSPVLNNCIQQLDEYFKHQRQMFDLPLAPQGTSFQKQVWEKLLEIPYGRTSSYLEIAKRIGNPKSIRAVGSANGKNPIVIIIPCHRVIGSSGKLIGYGGGLWRKEWLLKHEQSVLV